jgi:hypothetical protein
MAQLLTSTDEWRLSVLWLIGLRMFGRCYYVLSDKYNIDVWKFVLHATKVSSGWFPKGLWQWLIRYTDITLGAFHCLRYIWHMIREFSSSRMCAREEAQLTKFISWQSFFLWGKNTFCILFSLFESNISLLNKLRKIILSQVCNNIFIDNSVTGRGGRRSRLSHYLEKQLIDGGKLVSPMRRPQFTPTFLF